jgi:hypothetical protein
MGREEERKEETKQGAEGNGRKEQKEGIRGKSECREGGREGKGQEGKERKGRGEGPPTFCFSFLFSAVDARSWSVIF